LDYELMIMTAGGVWDLSCHPLTTPMSWPRCWTPARWCSSPRLAARWPSAATPSFPVFPATRFLVAGWRPDAPRDQSW